MRRLWELSFILFLCFSQNAFGQQTEPANGRIVQLCSDGEPVACSITLGGQNCYISSNAAPKCSTKGEDKSPYFKVEEGGKNYFHLVCTNKAAWKKDTTYNGQSIPRTDTPVKYHKIDLSEYKGCYLPCPYNCDKCDVKDGVPFCSHCVGNYYVKNNGQCSSCPSCGHCPNGKDLVAWYNCYMNNGNPQSCPTGKYSDEVSGKGIEKCKTCPTGCTKCTYAYEKGKVWCQSCDSGYTLENGQCIQQEKYTFEFYDKSGKFDSEEKNSREVDAYIGYLYGNKEYYRCVTDKENKKVICSCSGAGSSWHGYFKDKSRCEAWINSPTSLPGFCDVIDGYSSSHPNCQYVAKYCSNGCKKCTSSNCTECSSGFRLENGYCKEVKEYSIMFTDKKGSVGKDSTESFYPGTENDIITQFKALGKYKSNVARCSANTVGQEIECTCTLADTAYFLDMDRCSWYKDKLYTEGSDGVFCETNDATDNICPIKSTRCSANCLKCQSTDTCDQCKDGYTWNSENKKCLPPITPLSCPEPLKHSNDGRCCVL
ncbi:MAG: hypothetical protein IKR09_07120 [Alphaproteobacteria bacterium]|nr:hypothetical protein [Alphaproteobacteria bacterium]